MEQYGIRGPDPRNTVVSVPVGHSKEDVEVMLLPGDVVMVRDSESDPWQEAK